MTRRRNLDDELTDSLFGEEDQANTATPDTGEVYEDDDNEGDIGLILDVDEAE